MSTANIYCPETDRNYLIEQQTWDYFLCPGCEELVPSDKAMKWRQRDEGDEGR